MVGWLPALIGFLIITFVTGLSISIVFQLAHVVERTQFPSPNQHEGVAKQEWAIHQLSTTANFGTSSKWLYWLLGGLNFQIEHHLFPRISHIHYPQVSRFVKEACRESNIAYIEYTSMFKAIGSHLSHLKRLGRA
jgi:linoleoyl-CoA desaturase